ncbi:hypothetical protein BHF68_13225 [Desulfuribacillus alkaliarsenatis]|uniref:Flagellar hook-associated protein 2 C-terminal domain-containing protein n=1 Tax=Desulfuribacillus alkaliarsenatis TaxID=766136 RepID=A0A1E5G3Z7_9FIRM|nr:hypothetical protein BHF68_13225 [Desulfuribacillus alkaliarsenatis]
MFTNQSNDASNKGIGFRLYESAGAAIKSIQDKAGREGAVVDNSFMQREIRQYDEQIERFERRLASVEERYWRQFTAMEKALSQLHSQGDWLMQHMMQQ